MHKKYRLRKRKEFVELNKKSNKIVAHSLVLQAMPNADMVSQNILYKSVDNFKVGFTATKKIGSATDRNRAKRRLRNIWQQYY